MNNPLPACVPYYSSVATRVLEQRVFDQLRKYGHGKAFSPAFLAILVATRLKSL